MGLAASQARLLSITRRISDNELRAQLINNQKMRLASESSKVSENYINALNSTNLMFSNYAADNSMQTVPLTYNALTAYNQYNNQYVLTDVSGSVYLREDEAKLYAMSNHNLDDYLGLHGIEYSTTYWDTIADTIMASPTASKDIQEAAVIRAWYETTGINALSSVSGIEGCSMFPELYAIAGKIDVAAETYKSEAPHYNSLIVSARYKMTSSEDFSSYFDMDLSDDDYWLNIMNEGGNSFNMSWNKLQGYTNSSINKYINAGSDPELRDEFRNIFNAIWNYGNSKPISDELLNSLPGYWQDIILNNANMADTVISPAQFFDNGTHPNNYILEEGLNPTDNWSDYLFHEYEYEYEDQYGYHDMKKLEMQLPGMTDPVWVREKERLSFNPTYNTDVFDTDANGNVIFSCGEFGSFYKWTNNGQSYYIPASQTAYNVVKHVCKGSIIVADSNGDIPQDVRETLESLNIENLEDAEYVSPRKSCADDMLRDAIEDYLAAQLRRGNKIDTDDRKAKFRELGFTDEDIELLNNGVQSEEELKNLVKEFFNLLLGDGNSAVDIYNPNSPENWININNLQGQSFLNLDRLVRTVDTIVELLQNLNYSQLTSSVSGFDAQAENLFRNGFTSSITADNVLDQIYCIFDTTGIMGNDSQGQMYLHFPNFTYDGSGNTWPVWELTEQLKKELIYPAVLDFFNTHGMPIYGYMKNGEDATAEAEWYTNLFNKLEESGYKNLEKGLASSSDWVRFALENGIAIIEQLNTTEGWNKITYNSCSDITEETSSKQATLAEAEYNKAMNQIQAKDKRFDMELKNIDTEHSSLQAEYESVKKAMEGNVTRTFKLYS